MLSNNKIRAVKAAIEAGVCLDDMREILCNDVYDAAILVVEYHETLQALRQELLEYAAEMPPIVAHRLQTLARNDFRASK